METSDLPLSTIPNNQHSPVLESLYLIRETEQEIARRYPEGKMRCPTHLSIGQEGVSAVLSQLLTHSDVAVSTHRCHAHYLGKGGNVKAMLAEIYGREGGCSGGRGGSMHLIDESVGFKGSTAIVGNTIPIGVGLGLALKLDQSTNIAVVFVGDGALEEGVFYEAANFSVVQNLPILFVCENNLYSVYSPLSVRQPRDRSIYEMVAAMGLTSCKGDGNDVVACYQLLQTAISDLRQGAGPQFVEMDTYRWLEHCGPNYDNDIGYRSEEEFQAWKRRDPIVLYEARLALEAGWVSSQFDDLREEVHTEVMAAFDYAESQPYPDPESARSGLFREREQ